MNTQSPPTIDEAKADIADAEKALRRLVAWWDAYPGTRYDPELGPIVSQARQILNREAPE